MAKMMDLSNDGIVVSNDYLNNIKIVTDVVGQFKKAHPADAGYDILANSAGSVMPLSSQLISTGLQVAIPRGYVGIIKARSGLSVKHGLDVGAGVVDSGYTGEVKVLLRNTTDKWFDYYVGTKIAQMVIIPICPFNVYKVDNLEETPRGDNGFNSTGYH